MGSSIRATCQCGFEDDAVVGAGMLDFEEHCAFPGFCTACRSLITLDLLEPRVQCPDCGSSKVLPYDDPTLNDHSSDEVVESWGAGGRLGRTLELTRSRYFCPRCKRQSMRFEPGDVLFD